jgi:hypothetical protein
MAIDGYRFAPPILPTELHETDLTMCRRSSSFIRAACLGLQCVAAGVNCGRRDHGVVDRKAPRDTFLNRFTSRSRFSRDSRAIQNTPFS